MKRYILSPHATRDLFEIWSYLATQVSVATADRIESELYRAFEMLARTPGAGHKRPDLTEQNVLFLFRRPYLIVYRQREALEVVAVLHAKRDVAGILSNRD